MRCGGGSGRHERAIHDHISTLRAPGGGDTARISENFSGDRSGAAGLFAARPAAAGDDHDDRYDRDRDEDAPQDSGRPGRRYLIRGGAVMSMDPKVGDFAAGRRAGRGQEDPRRRAEPARGRRRGDRRARPHRDARLHRYAPPPVRDGAAQLPRRRHPDQRRLGLAERGTRPTSNTFCSSSPRCTGRRTCTSTSCSAGSASSTTASPRCTTSRRSITRPQHSDAAIQALFDTGRRAAFGYFESAGAACWHVPATSIRPTRPASRSSGSRRATSSST